MVMLTNSESAGDWSNRIVSSVISYIERRNELAKVASCLGPAAFLILPIVSTDEDCPTHVKLHKQTQSKIFMRSLVDERHLALDGAKRRPQKAALKCTDGKKKSLAEFERDVFKDDGG